MNLLAEAISSRYRNVGTVERIIDLIEMHILEPQEVRIIICGCGFREHQTRHGNAA